MIGIEGVLSLATYVTAIIASLQAASRAKYLLEHNEIGVKNGPLILPPVGNETCQLWDLVQIFQQSVLLGLNYRLNPEQYDFVVQKSSAAHVDHDYNVEPYSLSPFPKPSKKSDEDILDELVDMYIDKSDILGGEEEATISSSTTKSLRSFGSKVLPLSTISKVKETTIYWMTRAWYWRKSLEEFEELLEDVDEDTDLSSFISKKIRIPGADGNSTHQVAQICAYAPESFAKLRSYFNIPEESFRSSIFESGPYISFQSNSKGAARVGGVFFFTRDGTYMIKTIKPQEAETLIRILPKYYKHMKRYRRHSLLTRFCGLYKMKVRNATSLAGFRHEREYTFVVMNSVFPAESAQFITEMYDLKGSTVGREASQEEKRKKGRNVVLKDLDLSREVALVQQIQPGNNDEYGICLGAAAKSKLLAQLRKDVDLLRDCHVMDYSLLVGIANIDLPQVDAADVNDMELSINQERIFGFRKTRSRSQKMLAAVLTPVRLMAAPPLFFARQIWSMTERTMTSVLTYPLPYYGSSVCGVNGGALSVMHGKRSGKKAIYYMGLIDFLQPWTVQKVAENKLKGLLGQDTTAISAVDPEEYATRFVSFIDANVS